MASSDLIYLDYNATTAMCKPAIAAMNEWLAKPANASSTSPLGIEAHKLIELARKYIAAHCHAKNYRVIFTSGASESNCFIIRATVEAYKRLKHAKPHILTSLTEHKSVIKCCELLKSNGDADVTYLAPGASGCIPTSLVEHGLRDNTCLVTIMAANNELGCVNNLKEIGRIAHARNVPFHSDMVQVFGKYRINLPAHNIDAISASFHKLYGPKGSGLLVINDDLVNGYGLEGLISGTQEFGLRGGTENIAAIAGSFAALKSVFVNRAEKNSKLFTQREYIIRCIGARYTVMSYRDYISSLKTAPTGDTPTSTPSAAPKITPSSTKSKHKNKAKQESAEHSGPRIIVLGPEYKSTSADAQSTALPQVLPNTLMLAVVKDVSSPPMFCNLRLKDALGKVGVVISIGSACNTASPDASHVLDAIHAPEAIKAGVIRVSFGDTTTKRELDAFIAAFCNTVDAQMVDGASSVKKETRARNQRRRE